MKWMQAKEVKKVGWYWVQYPNGNKYIMQIRDYNGDLAIGNCPINKYYIKDGQFYGPLKEPPEAPKIKRSLKRR